MITANGKTIGIEKHPYLFFDTETTGLPQSWKEPVTNMQNWPHIVQIAWAQFDDAGTQAALSSYTIRPEGFVIPSSAAEIHGITTEKALEEGVPIRDVLEEFSAAVLRSDCLVGHNMDFDEKMVRVEFLRKNMPDALRSVKKICTMKNTADYCKLPGPYGYKWPKLSELHRKLFNADFEDEHDAAADVLCCAKCFFELKKLSLFPTG